LCRKSYQRNKRKREKREEQKKVDEEWKNIENMRVWEERKAERELKQ